MELSFKRAWDPSQRGKVSPLNIDKRFVVLRNSSGFYSYAIFEHLENMPAFNLNTARIAFMLNRDKFHFMAVANDIQRYMPDADDRLPGRGKQLAYKEAVRIIKPLESDFSGEVDDKYEYSKENKDNQVHGWISFDPPVGFWQITPSNEFRSGGPFKQDLTSHVNPTTLTIFSTSHYAGLDLVIKFKAGEVWKKVFGPVFVYLNSVPDNSSTHMLWDDAKERMKVEAENWPYNFTASDDFPQSDQRGTVYGRLLIKDLYINKTIFPAKGAYVGLAPPGEAGSWQRENKGYQFWTMTNDLGYFIIKNIRDGQYNIYASAPGFIGDYRRDNAINITAGSAHYISDLVYEPPRDGSTLWEIGLPDRSAKEFYVPDPNPLYINKLFVNHTDRFRQYGLWEKYADLYPDKDLVYKIGVNNYSKDWFFAQVTRKLANKTYSGTTWQIKFELGNIAQNGTYKLRLALASAHISELQVRVNDAKTNDPLFTTGRIGRDNAIARHGIHGLYWLFSVNIPSALLIGGNNTIYLTQTMSTSLFQGIMYDYIRLEGPPC